MNNTEFKRIIKSLVNSKVPFAVSGSWAMKLHANKAGVNSRTPHNVNIVLNPGNNQTVAPTVLYPLKYWFKHSPEYGKNLVTLYHFTVSGNDENIAVFNKNKHINILKAGGGLAPRLDNSTINVINGIPVLKVKQLIKKKQNVMNNYNVLKSPNKKKVGENLTTLMKLDKSPGSSPPKTTKKPRRTISPSSTTRRLF